PPARLAGLRDPPRPPDLLQRGQLRLRLGQQQGGGALDRAAFRARAHARRGLPAVREEPRPARALPAQGPARQGRAARARKPRRALGRGRRAPPARGLPRAARAPLRGARGHPESARGGGSRARVMSAAAQKPSEEGPSKVSWQEWSTHFLSLLRPYR